MNKQSIVKMVVVTFSLILMCSFGTYAQKTDCSKTTDAEITEAVTARIKAKYESQMKHILIKVEDAVVTLDSWVTTKKIRGDIEKIVKKTACVKKVVNNLKIGAGGSCPPGQQSCNGGCIPLEETCPGKTKDN